MFGKMMICDYSDINDVFAIMFIWSLMDVLLTQLVFFKRRINKEISFPDWIANCGGGGEKTK